MIQIDEKTCRSCGICGVVCPRHIPIVVHEIGKKHTIVSAERKALCTDCGHCAAVCPTASIAVDSFKTEDFQPLKPLKINEDQLLTLFRQRRSVRRYQDKPVPRPVLDRIAAAAHAAPTGTGRLTTGVLIVDHPEKLKTLMTHAYKLFGILDAVVKNSVARQFIRIKEGTATLEALRGFVMPGVRWYRKWFQEGKGDELRRDCPAMLIFYGPTNEPAVTENCTIAAMHAIFMAEILGVGSCFNSLLPPIFNRSAPIKKMLGLGEDQQVHVCVTLGYPKIRFQRVIPRRLAEIRYLD